MRRVPTQSRTCTTLGKDALAWMPLPLRGDRIAQHRHRSGRGGGARNEAGRWAIPWYATRMWSQPLAAKGSTWLRGLRAHGKRVDCTGQAVLWPTFQTLQFPAYLGRLRRPFFFPPRARRTGSWREASRKFGAASAGRTLVSYRSRRWRYLLLFCPDSSCKERWT